MTVLPPSRSNEEERRLLSGLSDEELVDRFSVALEGDTRAFDELVRRYEQMVRTNCRYLTRAEEDSWDLAQEVLMKAYTALDRFQHNAMFRTWMWRIKSNHCLNYLERRRVRRREEIMPTTAPEIRDRASSAPAPDELAASAETAERVRDALDALPDSIRIPLVLRDLDGLSYPEIAEHLDIGVPAAKMRISRARREFRDRYASRFTEAPPA